MPSWERYQKRSSHREAFLKEVQAAVARVEDLNLKSSKSSRETKLSKEKEIEDKIKVAELMAEAELLGEVDSWNWSQKVEEQRRTG